MQLERGHLFEGKYKIQRELGRGGFGTVYQARQLGMERDVAIKILTVDMQGEAALTARERFIREVRIISKLRHPNTVTIHDFGQTPEGMVYMVLEYVDGETLKSLVMRRGALEEKRAVKIAHQIARSLSEAHRHGIIHRDLKPQNIMLTELGGEQDFVKVLDFGIARFRNRDDGKDLTNTGNPNERELIGTPRYMSPEQVRGEEITGASDVYSLGLMCYEMLAGEPAVQGATMMSLITQQVSQEPLALANLHGFHPAIQQIIQKATHKSTQYRHRTVDLLIEELDNVLLELRRESASASNSSDFLLGNQYDVTPGMRQTGGYPQLPPHPHAGPHRTYPTGPHQALPPAPQMDSVLLPHNAPVQIAPLPPRSGAPSQPSTFGFADEQAETNLQLEPLTPQMLEQSQHLFTSNAPPPAQEHAFISPTRTPETRDLSLSALPALQGTETQGAFDTTQGGRAISSRLHPDDEEADASYVLTLLWTGALIALLIAAIYITFLMVGASVGVLVDGAYRLPVTCIIMSLLIGLPVLTETARKERFQVIYATLHRVKRVVSISLGLCIGTCILIALTLSEKVIVRLEGQPNWFLDSEHIDTSTHLRNAQASLGVAKTMRVVLGPLGLVDGAEVNSEAMPVNVAPPPTRPAEDDIPSQDGVPQPPLPVRSGPAPTRPATINRDKSSAPKRTIRNRRSKTPSPTRENDEKYQDW